MNNFFWDKLSLLQSSLVCLWHNYLYREGMVCLLEVPWAKSVKDCGTITYVLYHSSEQKKTGLSDIPMCQTKPEASNPQVGLFPTKSLPFQQWSYLLSSCECSCLYHSNSLVPRLLSCRKMGRSLGYEATIQTFQLTIKDTVKLGKLEQIKKIDILISILQRLSGQ